MRFFCDSIVLCMSVCSDGTSCSGFRAGGARALACDVTDVLQRFPRRRSVFDFDVDLDVDLDLDVTLT